MAGGAHGWNGPLAEAARLIRTLPETAWRFTATLRADRPALLLLGTLLATTFGFLILHLVATQSGMTDLAKLVSIQADGGIPELFNYLQTLACVLLFGLVYRQSKQPIFLAFALIFLFVLADDSLQVHEIVGGHLASAFHIPPMVGVRGQDVGELLTWTMAGAPLMAFLALSWWRSDPRATRAGVLLGVVFAMLVVFGAGFDMLVYAVPIDSLRGVFALLEDGGEMVSIALACTLALLLYRHPDLAMAVDAPLRPRMASAPAPGPVGVAPLSAGDER